MDKYFLDFERPLEEIYKQIQALEIVSKENPDLKFFLEKNAFL